MLPDIPLTPAEQRVSPLLLEGLSNRAIAERLVISHRTVECHISRVLAKIRMCQPTGTGAADAYDAVIAGLAQR